MNKPAIPTRSEAGRRKKWAVAAIFLAAIAASGAFLFGVASAAETKAQASPVSVGGLSPVAGVSVPVEDIEDVRCYYRADLEQKYPAPNAPGVAMPPFLLTGIMSTPTQQDTESLMLAVENPQEVCAALWDTNHMNPGGLTDDIIPEDFVTLAGAPSALNGLDVNEHGGPLVPGPLEHHQGHFVPELTECVVEGLVAVIPGPSSVCGQLGIPGRQK